MSDYEPDHHRTSVRELICPWCRADVGEPCVTTSGKRATYPHSARSGPLYRAYNRGYLAGVRA